MEETQTAGLPNTTGVRRSALIRAALTSSSAGRGTNDLLPYLSTRVHYSPGVSGFDGVALECDAAGDVESRGRTALHVDRPTVCPLPDKKRVAAKPKEAQKKI